MSREDDIRANHIYYDSSSQADIAWLLAELASVRQERDSWRSTAYLHDAAAKGEQKRAETAEARVAQLEAMGGELLATQFRSDGAFGQALDRLRALLASQPLPGEPEE